MAKDVKKTQGKNVKKENKKNDSKFEKNKKVVIETSALAEKKDNKGKAVKNKEKGVVKTETVKEVVKTDTAKKEKAAKKKFDSDKFVAFVEKVDDNRKAILFLVVGFLLGTLLFRCILWPDRIATLKDGTQPVASINGENFTADDLYTSMKEYYSVNILLNEIDDKILSEMYPEDEEMNNEINDTAEYYYSVYEQNYGYTKEAFLSNYGFADEAAFIESLKLDYRKNKYYEEYVEKMITDKEIENYYDDEVFGDVDTKHMLVKVSDDEDSGLSKDDAMNLAKEIISKLDSGKSWDEVKEEYSDQIVSEELGYNPFNASLESAYLEESKKLEVGKYSKEPVLTSYGYHVVFKIDQKDKPELDDVKDDIIDELATEKKNEDANLYYKALIAMRNDAKLEFVDTKLGDEYKEYVNSYK